MFFFTNKKITSLFLKKQSVIILISIVIFFYFFNSVLLGRNIYSNHITLVFNEAIQLFNGKKPYEEINILYGIGTPLVNVFSLFIFGKNLFSIILIANIFYFLSIFFILLICLRLKLSFLDNFFFILILLNIHPVLELPWSSYLSFFPIILSLYFILQKKKISYFASGLCLALACLIRETVLLSVVVIFIYIIFESFFFKKIDHNNLKLYFTGFFTPIIFFIIYMLFSSNYLIWLELIYPLYKWQSLINMGYYINDDTSALRRFYIFFLAPYREIFLTFLKSIYYFWANYLLIFLSYFSCFLILFNRIFLNTKNWNVDELTKYKLIIISIYSLSLILQNIHIPAISRIASGSIIALIILYYLLNKFVTTKKIRIIIYLITLILLIFNSKGVFTEIKFSGLNKFYISSFSNIKNNFNFFFTNKNNLDEKFEIKEFKNMNYDNSIHKFYKNFSEVCVELKKKNKEIKYSDNQTLIWELPYFCGTKPKYYYDLTLSEFLKINFKKSTISKKYVNNDKNTIGFYVSDNFKLIETMYFDLNGFTKNRKVENYKILYYADLKKDYTELFKIYGARYFFIIQNYKK